MLAHDEQKIHFQSHYQITCVVFYFFNTKYDPYEYQVRD